MQKAYNRINYENYPSEKTPLNETNLNRMDSGLNEVDNRVIALDTTKLDVTTANGLVQAVNIDNNTGVITVRKFDGSEVQLNTNLSKITLNASYDSQTQQILLTQSDGTVARIDLSTLIQQNEFTDTTTITFSVVQGVVSANIKAHSITDDHLQTNYLADIRVSEANARASEVNADADALLAESFAKGGTDSRTGEDTDNSKYYSEQSQTYRNACESFRDEAQALVDTATARLTGLTMQVNFTDGCLYYDVATGLILSIDPTTGNLMWEITASRSA